jgi:anti-sigma B factor antagonist
MKIRLEHATRDGILRVSGEIDLSNAEELERAIERAAGDGQEVLLDLSGVTFIDSSGLHAIRRAAASANCGPIVLVDAPSKVVRIIEIVGLDRTGWMRMRSRVDG